MLLFTLTAVTAQRIHDAPSDVLNSLIADVAAGNIDSLGEIYSLTRSSVYGYALSIVKNHSDAEDVTHDAYVAIATSALSYTPSDKPMAWILTIAKNLALMTLRRRRERELDEVEVAAIPDTLDILPADKMVLRECIERLSDDEREIVMLHAVTGYKHREIAEFLDMPLATVLSKYSRAIKKLRAALTEE